MIDSKIPYLPPDPMPDPVPASIDPRIVVARLCRALASEGLVLRTQPGQVALLITFGAKVSS